MNTLQKIQLIDALELLPMTNYRNERGLARAEKARFILIQKLRANLAEQARINPSEDALEMHLRMFQQAWSCDDANLWQKGDEYVLRPV